MTLRILTYNIRGARGTDGVRDYARIGRFLKEQRIDIALIQELDTRYEIETGIACEELAGDHFTAFVPAPTIRRDAKWYGNALFSRFPVTKQNILDISVPGREPRNILEVFLETPAGPLHVVNTHKGLSAFERRSQMAKLNDLLARKSEVPLVVGGDLNEWHTSSRALKKLNEVMEPLFCGATFPTRFPILRLDRLWCRPSGLVVRAEVLKTPETKRYSDHFPLLAEVEMGPRPTLSENSRI